MTQIRDAANDDLPRILQILNEAILNTTSSFDLTATTIDQRRLWMHERRAKGFPVLVAERDGLVAGFASFATFRPWQGYRYSVEHSIYIDPLLQGRGIGKALLEALIARAESLGIHVMIAGIEASNTVSLTLHRQAGFAPCGCLRQVGRKFDRWLDLLFMQKILSEPMPK